jgi:hypothetical protein
MMVCYTVRQVHTGLSLGDKTDRDHYLTKRPEHIYFMGSLALARILAEKWTRSTNTTFEIVSFQLVESSTCEAERWPHPLPGEKR